MRIRAITLTNVRRFTRPVAIDAIDGGLNVLAAANEHGKSTVFDALQALFFKAHGSKDAAVKSLQPHVGGAPEVAVDVETAEGRYRIAKRWLSKPAATVHRDGRLIAQAGAAEAWIAALVGGGSGGDPSGLVWVRQGLTELAAGTAREQGQALEARRDLLSSVTGEIEAMTGGRRMDEALMRCRDELRDLATANGKPRKHGPWHLAQEAEARLAHEREALATTARELNDALAGRKTCRALLADLADPEAVAERQARLEAATGAHRRAERHASEVEIAARRVDAARLDVQNAQARLEAARAVLAERDAAEAALDTAKDEAEAARRALETVRATFDQAASRLAGAQGARVQAREVLRRAERQAAARDGAGRRAELAARIEAALAARRVGEETATEAGRGPDAAALRRLESHAAELAQARAVREAGATQITVDYADGREGRVRIDGDPVAGAVPLALDRAVRLDIDGVGTIIVRPGAANPDDRTVAAAETALRALLDALGVDDLAAARDAAEARAEAGRRQGEARARLESLAPDGIDTLRAAFAAIPDPEATGAPLDLPEVERTAAETDAAVQAAQADRDVAADRLSDARLRAGRCDSTEAGDRDRLARAVAALDKLGEISVAACAAELSRATTALGAAEAVLEETRRTAPDIATAAAALGRAQGVVAEARDEIGRLKADLARLDERISRDAGDAVEERLAATAQALEAARADTRRTRHEVAVLQRLETALEAARSAARDRYFGPVAEELKPLLQLLWPEAALAWDPDTLLPHALVRDGRAEEIGILSGGTREQVALLVRLAFARMLARAGRHAPVILDDALVFTDDDRIDTMFDALHRQAGDLQIIVLTCRQRAFRSLGGRTLRLAAADAGAATLWP